MHDILNPLHTVTPVLLSLAALNLSVLQLIVSGIKVGKRCLMFSMQQQTKRLKEVQ